MADVKVELDTAGIAQILKSFEFGVNAAASSIAARIPGAFVSGYTIDRKAAAVVVPGGDRLQARDGVITRAASSVGLEVRSR